jgi:hypothetical protein
MASQADGTSLFDIVTPSYTSVKIAAKEDGSVYIGASTNSTVYFIQNNIGRILLGTDANIYLVLPGLSARPMYAGAPDSGGAGYRMLRVGN